MKNYVLVLISSFIYLSLAKASIVCPSNRSIPCDNDIHYLPLLGTAYSPGYPQYLIKYVDTENTNNCGIGVVLRKWYLDLNQDNIHQNFEESCIQNITVNPVTTPITITYPTDKVYACLDDIPNEYPTYIAGPCDVIGTSIKADTFKIVEGACYKIIKKYSLVNWCTYNPQTGEGYWEGYQVIKVLDENKPEIKFCEPTIIGVENDCKAPFTITNSASDMGNCSSQLLKWQVYIDLWADGTTDYTYGNTEAGQFFIAPAANNQEIKITLPIRVEEGKHKVYWSVGDYCGNFASCHTTVETKDLKKPTPYMYEFLTTSFEGNIEDRVINAICFNKSSVDNCTPKSKLRYSFSPDVNDTTRIVNCDNAGFQFYTIYITDLNGNQEFVEVFMFVLDNGSCQLTGNLNGTIVTSNSVAIQNAIVSMSRNSTIVDKAVASNNGEFSFNLLSLYDDYVFKPEIDSPVVPSVNIADVRLLQDYLFGLTELSNYQFIAADVNNDKKVNSKDLTAIMQLIFNNKSKLIPIWKYTIDGQKLESTDDLQKVKSTLDILDYDGNIDIVAVRNGDITDANEVPNGLRNVLNVDITEDQNFYYFTSTGDLSANGFQLILSSEVAIESLEGLLVDAANGSIINSQTNLYSTKDVSISKGHVLLKCSKESISNLPNISLKFVTDSYKTMEVSLRSSVSNETISFGPNPNNGTFIISNPNCRVLRITNHVGNGIRYTQSGQSISIELPTSGIYFVETENNGHKSTNKVLIIN